MVIFPPQWFSGSGKQDNRQGIPFRAHIIGLIYESTRGNRGDSSHQLEKRSMYNVERPYLTELFLGKKASSKKS
jgi:hypothetical protein